MILAMECTFFYSFLLLISIGIVNFVPPFSYFSFKRCHSERDESGLNVSNVPFLWVVKYRASPPDIWLRLKVWYCYQRRQGLESARVLRTNRKNSL